jgi:hypothetical protein
LDRDPSRAVALCLAVFRFDMLGNAARDLLDPPQGRMIDV